MHPLRMEDHFCQYGRLGSSGASLPSAMWECPSRQSEGKSANDPTQNIGHAGGGSFRANHGDHTASTGEDAGGHVGEHRDLLLGADVHARQLYETSGGGDVKRVSSRHPVPAPMNLVPEPETYALMLAGLAVLGAVGRRRKARG